MYLDSNYITTPGYDAGSRSGRLWPEQQQYQQYDVPEDLSGKLSYEALRAAYWDREKGRRGSSNDDV